MKEVLFELRQQIHDVEIKKDFNNIVNYFANKFLPEADQLVNTLKGIKDDRLGNVVPPKFKELVKKRFKSEDLSEPKTTDEVVDWAHSYALSILGDKYNEEITENTIQGILEDYKDEGLKKVMGVFKNGLRK